jgi:nitrite reductase (NADH) small subunit
MTISTAADLELNLGPVDHIPLGEGRNYDVAGEHVAVFHTRSGKIFATQAACPHRGGPLADGLIGGTAVICPLHSWKYDLSNGEPIMGQCKLKTYPVRLDAERRIVLTLSVPQTTASADTA